MPLEKSVGKLTSLQGLTLDTCLPTDIPYGTRLKEFGLQILNLKTLTELCLHGTDLYHEGIQCIVPMVQSLTKLKKVDCSELYLRNTSVDDLVECFRTLTGLQHVKLRKNSIRSTCIEKLLCQITNLAYLRHLDLSANPVRDISKPALSMFMRVMPSSDLLGVPVLSRTPDM